MQNPSESWTARLGRSNVLKLSLIDFVLFVGMSVAAPGLFLSSQNLASMATQLPGYGILALAMTTPMITGGIDLSIIALSNLTAIVAAIVLKAAVGPDPTYSVHAVEMVVSAAVLALTIGGLGGLLNGFIVAGIGVPPILATLASGLVFSGIAIAITDGTAVFGLPAAFSWIGVGQIFGAPAPAVMFILVAIVLSVLLTQTAFGAKVYLLGSNAVAARFSGIDIREIIFRTYVTSGVCAAIAGLVIAAGANSAKADYGSSYLLISILICVLGGVSPFGGSGRVSGVVLAVIALQILSSGLNIVGVNNFAAEFVWGGLLLLTMTIGQVQGLSQR